MRRVLYISYDGMLEPLGQSQVLAYQKMLAKDHFICLMSYEKKKDWKDSEQRERLQHEVKEASILWRPLRYHKTPSLLATFWDVFVGVLIGGFLIKRYKLELVHARSYVPALIAIFLKRLTGTRFVFDMRGFWADERIDGGIWKEGSFVYRVAKRCERLFILEADHIISLTNAGVSEIMKFSYANRDILSKITVIPTCADLNKFSPVSSRGGTSSDASLTFGYVGTVGTWYLFPEVVQCFAKIKRLRPNSRFLIVNRGEHAYILSELSKLGLDAPDVEVVSATHDGVPELINKMSGAVFFIKPVFSKQASAPTKLAELLGCGVPCLGNAGIGDMASVLEGEDVGIALSSFDDATLSEGIRRFLDLISDPKTKDRCVVTAQRLFSLEEGVRRYSRIYEQLGAEL